jgi:hypothetical protein
MIICLTITEEIKHSNNNNVINLISNKLLDYLFQIFKKTFPNIKFNHMSSAEIEKNIQISQTHKNPNKTKIKNKNPNKTKIKNAK